MFWSFKVKKFLRSDDLFELFDRQTIASFQDVRILSCQTRNFADSLNFSKFETANLQLAVTEISTNILKYAEFGSVNSYGDSSSGEIKLLFKDNGPGIKFIALAMIDGYTTFNEASLGLGLGAASRSVDRLELSNRDSGGLRVCVVKKRKN